MTPGELDAACRRLPAVETVVQWGGADVYKIGGRIFAVLWSDGGLSIKMSDIAFEALTASGRGKPATYLARAKWVLFEDRAREPGAEIAAWVGDAHRLVAARLTRKKRAELGLS